MSNNRRSLALALLILVLFLSLLASGCEQEQPASSPEDTVPTPTLLITPLAVATNTISLPPEGSIVREAQGDLNGDGVAERVWVLSEGNQQSLVIEGWKRALPVGQEAQDLQVRSVTGEKNPQVLVFTLAADGFSHYLYLYAWNGQAYALLSPQDGPLAGQEAFRSAYYPPHVEDGDFTGTEEIIVSIEAANPSYLEVLFYEWQQGSFRHATQFIAIPRHIPAGVTPRVSGTPGR